MSDQEAFARALAMLMLQHDFEVSDALLAHAEWKRRLRDAVVLGHYEHSAEDVGRDDLCELGGWLHSLPTETRLDPNYDAIIELHAKFHREAAVVLQFLEQGRIDDARDAMASDSEFSQASEELVGLLEAWREAA